MNRWGKALALGGLLCVALLGCGKKCDYAKKCNGNTLMTCGPVKGPGPVGDQDVENTEDCASEGGTCVQSGTNQAACQLPAPTSCDSTFQQFCQGTVLVYCDFSTGQGLVAGQDCSYDTGPDGEPGECIDSGGGSAGCVEGL